MALLPSRHALNNPQGGPPNRPSNNTGGPGPVGNGTNRPRGNASLSWISRLLLLALIVLVGVELYNWLNASTNGQSINMAYSDFIGYVNNNEVKSVTIDDSGNINGQLTQQITYKQQDGTTVTADKFTTFEHFSNDLPLQQALAQHNVTVTTKSAGSSDFWWGLAINVGSIVLLVALLLWFSRRATQNQQSIFNFGRSRAKLIMEDRPNTTFADVAGVDEAKAELEEVVEFLKTPQKFQRLGGKIPKGALLVGPPGTGKTLLARAVAGEAGVPFFSMSGSEFVEVLVGVGASRVRDLFDQAKKAAPSIIFIDEIDAVGRQRGTSLTTNDEREQTLNQLLVEMDGFEANEGIILIAATNRPDVLDPALLRPGRFDRQVVVPNPDVVGRENILKVHVKKVPLAPDVNLKTTARGTPGFSGADLANLVNEAALMAARRNKRMVTQAEFEDAKDKVMMGAERKSLVMTEEEKLLTAYHEGGHAIVAFNVKATDPVHKATIIPRGRALGMVMQLPERDKLSMSREQMTSRLAIMMGGRVAEEMVFGKEKVTSGAASDIEQATKLARMMVTRWGLSDELGTVAYGENQDEVFLGYQVSRQQNISEETSRKIDGEIRRLVEAGYAEATQILTEKRADLEVLAKGLLEFETLTGDEITDLLAGKRPVRESVIEPTTPRSSAVPPAGKPRPRPEPPTGEVAPQPQA